jgi:hypothetical protein
MPAALATLAMPPCFGDAAQSDEEHVGLVGVFQCSFEVLGGEVGIVA